MSGRRWRVAVVAVIGAALVVSVIAVLATRGGGRQGRNASTSRSPVLADASFAILWAGTRVGQAQSSVLARWPKHPYQHYSDNLRDDCYEWEDAAAGPDKHMPAHLYNLCFRDGVLRLKTVF
jgi:hypothetical protein